MTTPLISECADAEIQKVTVKLLGVVPWYNPKTGSAAVGTAWNVGEWAVVKAEIKNTSGAPLRDVLIKTMLAWQSAAKYATVYAWDGKSRYIGDLDVWETWTGEICHLEGVQAGPCHMFIFVEGEVVPFASSSSSLYSVGTVQPS